MDHRQTLSSLREECAGVLDKMEALINGAQRKGRNLTSLERSAYEAHEVQAAQLKARIKRVENMQNESSIEVTRDASDKREKGITFARIVRALAATKGNVRAAAAYAQQTLRDGLVAKALAAGSGSAGGFLVLEQFAAEIIELLRPQSAIRALAPVLVPLVKGNLGLGGVGTGATASYIGENQNILKTEPAFRQVRLSAKKLAALVPISNDLIRFSSPAADVVVRDELIAAIAQAEDAAFLRGQGSEYTPKGLRYWAGTINAMTASPTYATVDEDVAGMFLALRNNNVRFLRPAWIFAPRTEEALMTARDKNGNYIWRAEMLVGRFHGIPYRPTTQVPTNLGDGEDESEVYLADFADVVIGEVPGVVVDISSGAAYHDGTQLQSAFSLDQTLIKVILQDDLVVRHAESVAVLTGVTWTAPIAQPS